MKEGIAPDPAILLSLSKLSSPNDLISHRDLYKPLYESFEALSVALRKYSKNGQEIGISCPSPFFRRTASCPPEAIPNFKRFKKGELPVKLLAESTPFFHPAIEVLITMANSSKWSNNLDVINNLKILNYLDIADYLSGHCNYLSVPTASSVYVLVGVLVFEIKIVHLEEIKILEELEKSQSLKTRVMTQAEKLKKEIVLTPLVAKILEGISRRFYVFSETCQLVKKWLAFNFLSDAFEEYAIELLVAHVFVVSISHPTSAFCGLYHFLLFLSTFDFVGEPVIIDINSLFSPQQSAQLRADFLKRRPALPPLVLVMPEDPIGTMFTRSKPEPIILKRAISLCTSARNSMENSILQKNELTFRSLLVYDLSIFDLLIQVHGKHLVVNSGREKPNVRTSQVQIRRKTKGKGILPITNYNPVQEYIEELRNNFGSIALFFSNMFKSYVVGVVFRPSFLSDRDGKVMNGSELRLKDFKTGALKPNIPAFIEDIKVLGHLLVRGVKVSERLKPFLPSELDVEIF